MCFLATHLNFSVGEEMSTAESKFQTSLIHELRRIFPDCVIQKNDPEYMPGLPDLTIYWGKHWAMLECKAHATAPTRPNQPYYIEKLNEMSFAAFIYPENKDQVLHALQIAFGSNR